MNVRIEVQVAAERLKGEEEGGTILRALEQEHGIREEKVEEMRKEQLIQRNTKARAQGRNVAAVQRYLRVPIQLTAQFIRSLRNAILAGMHRARAPGALPRLGRILRLNAAGHRCS